MLDHRAREDLDFLTLGNHGCLSCTCFQCVGENVGEHWAAGSSPSKSNPERPFPPTRCRTWSGGRAFQTTRPPADCSSTAARRGFKSRDSTCCPGFSADVTRTGRANGACVALPKRITASTLTIETRLSAGCHVTRDYAAVRTVQEQVERILEEWELVGTGARWQYSHIKSRSTPPSRDSPRRQTRCPASSSLIDPG